MMENTTFGKTLLSPPTATLLLYAADGLSVWKKQLSPKGFPRTPERDIWVPMFHELVKSDEGMKTLHNLTKIGMKAWRCPPDTVNSLKAAFNDVTIRALMIASLEYFAATARMKVILAAPPPPRPYPPPQRPLTPKPEQPHRTHSSPPVGPHRPTGRRNSPGPMPD